MNALLTWGFVPLFIAGAFRFVYTDLNEVAWYDIHFISDVELVIYGICVALALVSFWHNFVRERCPFCRAVDPDVIDENEIDRFVGTKRVNGTDGMGRSTTHHVSTTFAKVEYHYACQNPDCTREWHKVVKREVC